MEPLRNAHPNWDFNEPDEDCSASFATLSFAEGASRRAYRAMYWKPASKYGRKAVVKEYKHEYTWAQRDWDTAVKTYEKTKELASQFNEESQTSYPVHVVDYSIGEVIDQVADATPELGEYILLEDYLEGHFQKFISNTGWVSPQCQMYTAMPAFAHWSWVRTKGQLMVTDLQGVRYKDKYVLTDPCVLSLKREYGATDLALVGMAFFFMSHECTNICHSLGIADKRPDFTRLKTYMKHGSIANIPIQMPTSYLAWEDYERIPAGIRAEIQEILTACFEVKWW